MKRHLVFSAFLLSAVATSVAAQASEPEPPVRTDASVANWSGFYIGAYAGGAWGDADIATSVGNLSGSSYFQPLENIASVERNASGSAEDESFVGGVQIGGNLQHGIWVYGAEIDFGAMNLDGSLGASDVAYPTSPATYSVASSFSTDWLMTARARLGFAISNNLLIYATGGLALTELTVTNSFSDDAPSDGTGGRKESDQKSGWVVGGGVELALSSNWSLKGEYLHLDFGSVTTKSSVNCGPDDAVGCSTIIPGGVTPSAFNTRADLTADIVRAALVYKF